MRTLEMVMRDFVKVTEVIVSIRTYVEKNLEIMTIQEFEQSKINIVRLKQQQMDLQTERVGFLQEELKAKGEKK